MRAKVEHSIGVIQQVFGFQKVRYRGLAKNRHRLEGTAALANRFTVRPIAGGIVAVSVKTAHQARKGHRDVRNEAQTGFHGPRGTSLPTELSASVVIFADDSEVP